MTITLKNERKARLDRETGAVKVSGPSGEIELTREEFARLAVLRLECDAVKV